ncbi:hypothetical protein N7466_002911 [Penicillium verhagenii]|uniref:uncharacterized protein n=1 Tax=Penicillium verhagenii TaxID=1562060 RepID=UPI0025454247|nr:uncharacterized protein N7466_002911 [Penicillium verhagenii]KAJ5939777.1 hypothetical protein N7466_002911 [Penicillium verhagenii]
MSAFTIDYDTTGVDNVAFSTRTDNNWDDVTTVARTDQSSDLAAVKITLNPVKNPLRKAEDYESWKRIVQINLKLRGMDGLIDYNLPRPAQNGTNA